MCAISFQHLLLPVKHLPHTSTPFLDFLTPLPASHHLQYYMKVISDRWIGCESKCTISFQHLILPERHPPHTGTQLFFVFLHPLPASHDLQYYMKVISDRWIGCESMCAISFQHLILPERHPPHKGTQLFCLNLLPASHDLQYYVKVISDRWIGCESKCTISFQHLILPEKYLPHMDTPFFVFLTPLPASHDLQYYVKFISDRWIGDCESMCAISFQHLILPERHFLILVQVHTFLSFFNSLHAG